MNNIAITDTHIKYKTLEVGEVYTYKQLCEKLNESVCSGNTRKSQEKEWKSHFRYTIRKNKSIAIQEVFNEAVLKIDKRSNGNNNIYSNLVQLVLLDYLARNIPLSGDKRYLNLSKIQMYEILDMCNETYIKEFIHKYKQDELHKEKINQFKLEHNLSEYDLYSFYDRSIVKFNQTLNNAISSLKKKYIVVVQDNYVIKEFADTDFNCKLRMKILDKYYSSDISRDELSKLNSKFENTETRFATPDENADIARIYRKVLDKLNIKDIFIAYQPYNINAFFKELSIAFLEEMNWCMCYSTKTFSFTEETLRRGVELIEEEIERIKLEKRNLNKLLKDSIDNKAMMEYNDNKIEFENTYADKILNQEKVFKYKDSYREAQRIVSEFFMNVEEE